LKITNAGQVAQWRLCTGCGACAYICPQQNIKLIDVIEEGIRPISDPNKCNHCGTCLTICPGYEIGKDIFPEQKDAIKQLQKKWGQVLEVWEGYATDPEIRFTGSSGGMVSALALYCLEKEGMGGVLHTAGNERNPLVNQTVLSRSREDILRGAGSRYAPVSPCGDLKWIEESPTPCVFVGKPCDAAAVRKAIKMREVLRERMGLILSIFCAGTPSSKGSLDLLDKLKINRMGIEELRYRGKGWPGLFYVKEKDGETAKTLPYKEAWGFLQAYRPYRCHLCPDSTGELADIACGDPWYRKPDEDNMGYSLVLVRTERGRKILRNALREGYVILQRADPGILQRSQQEMPIKKGAVWGRIMTFRAFGLPTPRYKGFALFKNWLAIPFKEKARSTLGTARRIIQRKYYKKVKFTLE